MMKFAGRVTRKRSEKKKKNKNPDTGKSVKKIDVRE